MTKVIVKSGSTEYVVFDTSSSHADVEWNTYVNLYNTYRSYCAVDSDAANDAIADIKELVYNNEIVINNCYYKAVFPILLKDVDSLDQIFYITSDGYLSVDSEDQATNFKELLQENTKLTILADKVAYEHIAQQLTGIPFLYKKVVTDEDSGDLKEEFRASALINLNDTQGVNIDSLFTWSDDKSTITMFIDLRAYRYTQSDFIDVSYLASLLDYAGLPVQSYNDVSITFSNPDLLDKYNLYQKLSEIYFTGISNENVGPFICERHSAGLKLTPNTEYNNSNSATIQSAPDFWPIDMSDIDCIIKIMPLENQTSVGTNDIIIASGPCQFMYDNIVDNDSTYLTIQSPYDNTAVTINLASVANAIDNQLVWQSLNVGPRTSMAYYTLGSSLNIVNNVYAIPGDLRDDSDLTYYIGNQDDAEMVYKLKQFIENNGYNITEFTITIYATQAASEMANKLRQAICSSPNNIDLKAQCYIIDASNWTPSFSSSGMSLFIDTRNYPAVAGMKDIGVWHVDATDPCNTGGWYKFTSKHTLSDCSAGDKWALEVST